VSARLTFCSTSRMAVARLVSAIFSNVTSVITGEAERRLVQHQLARLEHQPASDCEHLLLTAAQGAGSRA
jgi:hypothetical protein